MGTEKPKACMEPKKIERRTKQRLPPTQPYYPWLLYFHGENQTFCNISDPTKTYSRNIPELGERDNLWTVQYGWFLLEKSKIENVSELFLWNPYNLEEINLPLLKHDDDFDGCIFSCSPTATDEVCSIVLFSYRGGPIAGYSNIVFYCQLGDKQWTKVDYTDDLVKALAVELEGHELLENYIHRASAVELEDDKLLENFIHLDNPVYCNSRLYAASRFPRLLVVIEKLEPHGLEINSTHVFLPDEFPVSFAYMYKLLESNNELFHISISLDKDKIISIAVHRLDFSQMVWVRVKSIKDRVFFLSSVGLPFTCQAINPEIEGGLIYLSFYDSNFLHIYNIQDNSLVIGQTFSNLQKWRYGSLWFMSDRRMTHSIQEEREKTHSRGGESSVAILSNETRGRASNSCAFSFENIHDYLHFRATNNFFRLRAPVPFQRRSLSMSSFDHSCSPLFVFFEQENFLTFVHPKHGINYKYSMNLPEEIQGGSEICYSKDSWLAVNRFCDMFFNPFTNEVKQLACGPLQNIVCLGFSHPPTSSECVVVEILPNMTVYTTCLKEENGEEDWEEANFENCDFHLSNTSPCFYNGAFYYLSNEGKLGIVKVGEEGISWEVCEKPDAPRCARTNYYKCFLVECKGSLLSIFEGYFGNWVRVFKLNEVEMKWVRVTSLENHMLFVGNQSFSAMASISGMENKIYFPRFHGDYIVFYSLDTKNYHTFESTEVVDFHCMREQLNSSWILPRWR